MSDLCDRQAEDALLAACIYKPESYHAAANNCSADDFANLISAAIFRAVGELHSSGIHPDPVTITDSAASILAMNPMFHSPDEAVADKLESLKGLRFSSDNVERYAQTIRRLSSLRAIEHTLNQALGEVTQSGSPDEIASSAMETLLKVASPHQSKDIYHYSELRERYIETLQAEADYLATHGELPGIRFGFNPVDRFTHGMRPENLMILAGEPGSGKTSVSMSLLRRRAMSMMTGRGEIKGSLFVSLEMGEDATAMRWSQMIASMTTKELRGGMDRARISHLDNKWGSEDAIPLWALFASGMKADQLKARIAYMVKKHNIDLIVLDHFRRVRMDGRLSDNALDEARIQYIKQQICQSLGVSVIVIAHTNKSAAGREDKKPRMSDLSGSTMVAAEADYIVFVYRPYEHLTDSEKSDPACAWEPTDAYLVWRKNRNDSTGDARFHFDGSTMNIEDAAMIGRPMNAPQPPPPIASHTTDIEELF